jgi:EmrB/QacA subfamily drug resistance transporter
MSAAPVRPGYLLPHRTTVLAISGALMTVVLAASGQTILVTAMPAVAGAVGGTHDYTWLFSCYLLATAVTVPLYGRLSDIYGRRPFLVGAIILYLAGSVVGATAGSIGQLVVARTIQGLAAGALIPLPQAVIADLVPPSERGRWQGLFGAAVAIASLLGPLGGGWLADHAPWQWVFLAPMPIGALALVIVWLTLRIPPHADRRVGVDVPGALLLTLGLGGALLATATGGHLWAWGSPTIVVLFLGAALALCAFVVVERRSPHPLVPLALLTTRTMGSASVAGIGIGACQFAALAFVPLFVQGALAASATDAGLVLVPLLLAMVAGTLGSGQVIARTGRYRWALLSGPAVCGAGYAWLATLDSGSSRLEVTLGTVLVGAGVGLLWQNLLLVVQNVAPAREAGVATSAAQLCRSLGNTIGVTVMGAVVAARLGSADPGFAATLSDAQRAEAAAAVHPVFVACVPICAVVLIAALLIPETPLRRSVRDEAVLSAAPAAAVPARPVHRARPRSRRPPRARR